jgi:hypothetical protein
MKIFKVHLLILLWEWCGTRALQASTWDPKEWGEYIRQFPDNLDALKEVAAEFSLTSVAAHLDRIQRAVNSPNPPKDQVAARALLRELENRIQDDLLRIKFAFIPPDKDPYYEKLDFGTPFNKAFPKLGLSIKEAGTCYALGQNTACVFHLMRVMESGVQRFGKKLGISAAEIKKSGKLVDKTWGAILNEIEPKLKGLPQSTRRQRIKFEKCSGTFSYLCAVKDAWRNPTMHPRASYEDSEAFNIISMVRCFMNDLAS